VLDALDGEQELQGMLRGPSAELAAIVGQNRADLCAASQAIKAPREGAGGEDG
jgi:hypothetical protein